MLQLNGIELLGFGRLRRGEPHDETSVSFTDTSLAISPTSGPESAGWF